MRSKKRIFTVFGLLMFVGVCMFAATRATSTIETARIAGEKARAIEIKGSEFGLNCLGETATCIELIARAEKNPQLKSAFLRVQEARVSLMPNTLYPFSAGHVGNGWITINPWYSDEKILAFLTK